MREKKPEKQPAVWTTEEFEYTFSEKVRGEVIQIKAVYIIILSTLVNIAAGTAYFLGKIEPIQLLSVAFFTIGIPVLGWWSFRPNRPANDWVKKSLCAMDCDGIYLVSAKGKREFIPWESIVAVDRRRMSQGGPGEVVICCYRTLEGKRMLDLTEASMTLKRGRDVNASMFYQVRDEVVTIGYTKSRMKKNRAYWRQCEGDG